MYSSDCALIVCMESLRVVIPPSTVGYASACGVEVGEALRDVENVPGLPERQWGAPSSAVDLRASATTLGTMLHTIKTRRTLQSSVILFIQCDGVRSVKYLKFWLIPLVLHTPK